MQTIAIFVQRRVRERISVQSQWTGTLTVEGATFERQGSSLNKLLHKLDDAYRATKIPAPTSAAETPAPAAS